MKAGKHARTDTYDTIVTEDGQILQRVRHDFGMTRRGFVQTLGAGIVIATAAVSVPGQQRGGRGGRGGGFGGPGPATLDARLHIAKDGTITVMSGKVEGGQGARAEIAQAAAEELRVPVGEVRLILADTELCPDDGPSWGSQTTPRTLPVVRSNCAAARELLIALAARTWNVTRDAISIAGGTARNGSRKLTYGDLASLPGADEAFKGTMPQGATVTAVDQWKVMGVATPRPNRDDLVKGVHPYPSAIVRPGMLYGKILRAPTLTATLKSVDVSVARAMQDVVVVKDNDFVGVAAPTTYRARKAIEAIARTAEWERSVHPASRDLPRYLRDNAVGRMPPSSFTESLSTAAKTLKASYDVAYVQHAPLEPRAAVAEWEDGKLTVWTGGQNPFGVRGELQRAFNVAADRVRVIVNDFGAAFGGKHTGEAAIEAARLARGAGKPVSLTWTREEEFTWAAFRSAAAIDIEASLDAAGKITSWHHVVVQASNAAADTPYTISGRQVAALNPQAPQPLRLGSYRALGSTANVFAREAFMDELAFLAGNDPLQFRLDHLDNSRLRAVLEDAAKRFDWNRRRARTDTKDIGVGLACATEKGSFVAACVEIALDRPGNKVVVRNVTETFECGAIVNPVNLFSQVQGAIIQGLGPALREEMEFAEGVVLNSSFTKYRVPRFADLPQIDINLLNRPDLPSAGAGETPLIAVAAAISNAIFHATGKPARQMPMTLQRILA